MHSDDVFVDVGKSGMRLSSGGGSHPLVAESSAGISPAAQGDQGQQIVNGVLVLLQKSGLESVTNLLIGSTAELTGSERATVARELQQLFPACTVGITDDGTLAHARYLNSPGILAAVGTGVIVITRDQDDELRRRDGWGPLVGDRGSAVSVGLDAINTAFSSVDDDRQTPLRIAVESVLGALDVNKARDLTARADWPVAVGELAPLVCRLAAERDTDATRILETAAADVAATIRRSADMATVSDIMIVGRFGLSDQMLPRITARLHESGLTVRTPNPTRQPSTSSLLGGAYRPWVHVYTAGEAKTRTSPV